LSANIKLGWKRLAIANAQAYKTAVLITSVKSIYYKPYKSRFKNYDRKKFYSTGPRGSIIRMLET